MRVGSMNGRVVGWRDEASLKDAGLGRSLTVREENHGEMRSFIKA